MRYVMKVEIILPTTTFGRVYYKLLEPLCLLGHKVPVGFTSDGATVPRILWALFPPVGRYFLAAVLHDPGQRQKKPGSSFWNY